MDDSNGVDVDDIEMKQTDDEKGFILNFDDDIDEATIIENMSIGVTFLLHKDSPRWGYYRRNHCENDDTDDEWHYQKTRFQSLVPLKVTRKLGWYRRITEVHRLVKVIYQLTDQETVKQRWADLYRDWRSWATNNENTSDNISHASIMDNPKDSDVDIDIEADIDEDLQPSIGVDSHSHRHSHRFSDTLGSDNSQRPMLKTQMTIMSQELSVVQTEEQLRVWLLNREQKKTDADLLSKLETAVDQMINDSNETKGDIDISNTLMREWERPHVVLWLQSKGYHQLAKIFSEMEINGSELSRMGWLHIQLMYNTFKSPTFPPMSDESAIEIERAKERRELRIQSTDRYEASWRLILQSSDPRVQEQAAVIAQLVDLLRVSNRTGPFDFWAADGAYYDKIDDCLMMLIMEKNLRQHAKDFFSPSALSKLQSSSRFPLTHFDNKILSHGEIQQWYAKLQCFQKSETYLSGKQIVDWIGWSESQLSIRKGTDRKSAINIANQLLQASKLYAYDKMTASMNGFQDKNTALYSRSDPLLDTALEEMDCRTHSVPIALFNIPNKCVNWLKKYVTGIIICLVIFFGCVGNILYWSYRSEWEIDSVMHLAIIGVTQRHSNALEYTSSVANSLLSLSINGLRTGDLNGSIPYASSEYDQFFTQWYNLTSARSISGVLMYNVNTSVFIGGTLYAADRTQLQIVANRGACLEVTAYDITTNTRSVVVDGTTDPCQITYDPKSRAWYQLATEGELGQYQWTDSYTFAVSGEIGLTLTTRIQFENSTYVFLVDRIATDMQSALETLDVPLEGVVYMSMSNYDVIASSTGDIHYSSEHSHTCGVVCTSSDNRITDTLNYLHNRNAFDVYDPSLKRIHIDKYEVAIAGIPITFGSTDYDHEHSDDHEYAYLVVVYPPTYKQELRKASVASWTVSGFIILIVFVAIVVAYSTNEHSVDVDEHGDSNDDTSASESDPPSQPSSQNLSQKHAPKLKSSSKVSKLRVLKQIQQQKALDDDLKASEKLSWWAQHTNTPEGAVSAVIQICQVTLVILMIAIYVIWHTAVSSAYGEIMKSILLKEEYYTVQERVLEMFKQSETIAQVLAERFKRHNFDFDDRDSMDQFFVDALISFRDLHGNAQQNAIYLGTPDGRYHGAWQENDGRIFPQHRDASTEWSIAAYDGIGGVAFDVFAYYDPRCRSWYKNAMQRTFSGTLNQAFPYGYANFRNSSHYAFDISECNTDAVQFFDQLFGVTTNPFNTDASTYYLSDTDLTASDELTWSKYFFQEGMPGLTASAAVVGDNGELLAVVAIDYTLEAMSDYLNNSIALTDQYNSQWYSWLFEANPNKSYEMIAASNHIVATAATAVEGCLQFESTDDFIAYGALEHPTETIALMSAEIIEVHGISNLATNSNPSTIRVPTGFPHVEAGRTVFQGGSGIDWIIANAISIDGLAQSMEDDQLLTMLVTAAVVSCFVYLLQSLRQSIQRKNIDEYNPAEMPLVSILENVEPLVRLSAEMRWKQQKIAEQQQGPVSMGTVRKFCARRAVDHIIAAQSKDQFFDDCLMEAGEQWHKLQLLQVLRSYWYMVLVYLVMLTHITVGFAEPPSPKQLKENGLDSLVSDLTIFCLVFEWIDFILLTTERYFTFEARHSSEHSAPGLSSESTVGTYTDDFISEIVFEEKPPEYQLIPLPERFQKSIFWGIGWFRYDSHLALLIIITINFLTTVTAGDAIFSYYIPLIPLLLINRSPQLHKSFKRLLSAIQSAYDVLFLFFCTIMVAAAVGLALFRTTLNVDQGDNNFSTFYHALITIFIYVSNAENYDETIYPAAEISEIHLIYFFALVLISSFVLMPVIIYRFEQSFTEARISADAADKRKATNTLVAAFTMLDLDGNREIDGNDFQGLINLTDAFHLDDKDGTTDNVDEETFDLGEFTDAMIDNQLSDSVVTGSVHTFFWQAWLETHVVRPDILRRTMVATFVIPAVTCSFVYGLTDTRSTYLDIILLICFIANALEILMRVSAFGWKRFFRLHRYNDPPYIEAAALKWKREHGLEDKNLNIPLPHNEWKKAENELNAIPPLSRWDRETLSLVNTIEFFGFLISAIAVVIFFKRGQLNYCRVFFQASTFRVFTQILGNREIIFVLWTVVPQFLAFACLAVLLTVVWARLGCAFFSQSTDVVLDDIYNAETKGSFDTLTQSMMALLQLALDEGLDDMLYDNVFATDFSFAWYFAVYNLFMTIIVTNVFIGLILAGIREFKEQQSQLSIITQSFHVPYSQFKQTAVSKRNQHLQLIRSHSLTVEKIDRAIRRSARRSGAVSNPESPIKSSIM